MDQQHPEPRVVRVYSGRNELAAHMLANYLESNGIPATVNGNQTLLNLFPEDPTAMVGVLVAEEDAETARQLIAERPDRGLAARERLSPLQTRSPVYQFLRWCMIAMFIACVIVLVLIVVATLW
jgi:hypothetical protein